MVDHRLVEWIVGIWDTNHMTPYYHILTNQKNTESSQKKVQLPNGTATEAIYTGSYSISSDTTLHNVLLIPDFKFNLMSVSQLTKALHS